MMREPRRTAHRFSGCQAGVVGDVEIRSAGPPDLDAIQGVYRRASLWNEGDRDVLLANPDALIFDPAPLTEGRTRVAVDDGVVVGFASTRREGDALELDDLFVDPDHMRRGIGLALVRDATAVARRHGIASIGVTANPHARDFYAVAGFVPAGTTETRFGPAPRRRLAVRD
jgi:GNAT superfamily N-acetyltransferase